MQGHTYAETVSTWKKLTMQGAFRAFMNVSDKKHEYKGLFCYSSEERLPETSR